MNELTIEMQRVLTEALGEIFHEPMFDHDENMWVGEDDMKWNPDFNDGRVTMRLIELVDEVKVRRQNSCCDFFATVWVDFIYYNGFASTIEIAIAKAVYTYIVAKEK